MRTFLRVWRTNQEYSGSLRKTASTTRRASGRIVGGHHIQALTRMTTDMPADAAADDGRWLSYAEIAHLRGISIASAKRLVLRHRWRRQTDNRNVVRILVPADTIAEAASRAERSADTAEHVTPDVSHDIGRVMAALDATIAALTIRAERAEAEADRVVSAHASAVAAADKERVRADEATARLEAATVDLVIIRGERDVLAVEMKAATQRVEQATAEVERMRAVLAEWQRRPWWRRLWGPT